MKKVFLIFIFYLLFGPQGALAQMWRDSLSTLNRAIRLNPKSTDLRLKKAAVNIELGQWDYAAEEYTEVLKLDNHNLAALYYRAYANMNRRQYGLAKADYEAFLAISPLHLEARMGLATVCQRMGRTTDARDEYNRLVEMFPDSALAYAARATFETSQQSYELAAYDWDKAVSLDPLNEGYVASLADALLALGQRREAHRALEAAIRRGIPRSRLKYWLDKCK